MSDYFIGAPPRSPSKRIRATQPPERRGAPSAGCIVRLFVGQGHGFIRLRDDREVYFHRSDLPEGTSINDFVVGDHVAFELLEDSVSGARALRVRARRHIR